MGLIIFGYVDCYVMGKDGAFVTELSAWYN